MQLLDVGNYENIVYTNFQDTSLPVKVKSCRSRRKEENRSLTPIIGSKIAETKSGKIKLNVKMPRVRVERTGKILSLPTRNISVTPTRLLEHCQITNYSPPGLNIKPMSSKNPSKKYLKVLPDIKSPIRKRINTENIYSELLGFLIKVQVEYLPIYQKIDIQRKGKIDYSDFSAFISKSYISCNPKELFNNLTHLNLMISSDCVIWKKNFLAICTGLRHNKPTAKDFKLIFIDPPFEDLVKVLQKHVKMFREFTEFKYLELEKLLSRVDFSEEKIQKSLKIVFSESVDLPRFISCLPFFIWVKHYLFIN